MKKIATPLLAVLFSLAAMNTNVCNKVSNAAGSSKAIGGWNDCFRMKLQK